MDASKISLNSSKVNQMEQFVRNSLNHSYNKEVFEKQLGEEMERNLVKMQEHIIKDMKRRLLLEKQLKQQEEKKNKIVKDLQEKLNRSKQIRQKQKQDKLTTMATQRKQKHDMFIQRLQSVKNKGYEDSERRLDAVSKKLSDSRIGYNKINTAVSLLEEPSYVKNQRMTQQEIDRLRELVSSKNKSLLNNSRRQISLLEPTESNQFINEEGKENEKGAMARSKSVSVHLPSIEERGQEESEKIQTKKKQYLLSRLNRQYKQPSLPILGKRSLSMSSLQKKGSECLLLMEQSKRPVVNSIIYEQSEDRQKYSYRKDIKNQIREYLLAQKSKLLQ